MHTFQLKPVLTIQGIGAASGILLQENALYIISDSSSFLYRYPVPKGFPGEFPDEYPEQLSEFVIENPLQKIALVSSPQDHIEKKNKFDLESLCQKDQSLYLFGSGSTAQRQHLFKYDLLNQHRSQIDLSGLYAQFRLKAHLAQDELNIEGVVFDQTAASARWIFLQRGNGINAKNGLFVLSGDALQGDTLQAEADIQFIAIQLPRIGNVETSFTDACLYEEKIYFLAAAEDTSSTYDDGEVLGSLIGCISLRTFQLERTQQITDRHKFEGLTVLKQREGKIAFLLCEDNDTATLQSTLYELSWQI